MLGRAALRDDLAAEAFALGRDSVRPPRIGAEVELLAVDAETGAPAPIAAVDGPATLPLLRAFGGRRGWREEPSSYGVPRFVLPDGGILSFEPGGQVELSAAAHPTASALLDSLRETVPAMRAELREGGIDLLAVGVDPRNGIESVPLRLPGTRYVRMTAFMEAIGTGGARMMRQTASFQVSLDFGADPLARWRLWNAMAPYVTAIFANSPVYRGVPTGDRSVRARIWRELDGGRTGCFPCADPIEEYLDFALAAPVILGPGDGSYRPFAEWDAAGCMGPDEWRLHLTTLFPEVRPKGFAEVRSADAVDPRFYAAPLVLLAGVGYDDASLRAALDLLGDPDPSLLVSAGRDGLSDPSIARISRDLADLAMRGARSLGGYFSGADLEEAEAFFSRYTRLARSPADDVLDTLVPAPVPAA